MWDTAVDALRCWSITRILGWRFEAWGNWETCPHCGRRRSRGEAWLMA
jgi:hypothetical protein